LTIANAKRIYLDLLNYFATRQDKLFVVITAPPLAQGETTPQQAINARAFNQWLMNDWLTGYLYNNVAVFDFYNVLTSNGGSNRINDPDTNDLGWTDGNHHRWRNATLQHSQTVNNNYSAYWTADSHPSQAGNLKATGEFVPLLNIFYHRWQGGGTTVDLGPSSKTVSTQSAAAGARITYTVAIRNASGPLNNAILFTDTLPTGLTYLPGTLAATSGVVTDTAAPLLRWSGVLTPTPIVTITYAAMVSVGAPGALTNKATITAPGVQTITRSALFIANGYSVYLPLVLRNHVASLGRATTP
jgi:uncharacterized repeat protein (TIGR01451 family)